MMNKHNPPSEFMRQAIDRFIANNCDKCSRKKPKSKTARCELWNGMRTANEITLNNTRLFWNDDESCKYFE